MSFTEAAEKMWAISVAAIREKCNVIDESISKSNFVDYIVFSTEPDDEPEPAYRMLYDKINNNIKIEPYY